MKLISFAFLAFLAGAAPAYVGSTAGTADPEIIIQKMEQRNEQRREALRSYRGRRRYFTTHPLLLQQTYLLVEERYEAPGEKQFRVIERGGSREVEHRVFAPLLETERAQEQEPARQAVDLCRRNYTFTFLERDMASRNYVFAVEPRTSNRYLLRGKIWIDAQDFAVRRIEGEPAERPSSLVRRTRFVHEYAKFGDFWFQVRHRSEVDLGMLGRATMGIDYFDYDWQPRRERKSGE